MKTDLKLQAILASILLLRASFPDTTPRMSPTKKLQFNYNSPENTLLMCFIPESTNPRRTPFGEAGRLPATSGQVPPSLKGQGRGAE